MIRQPRTDENFRNCPDAARWSDVLARITRERAVDLDAAISGFDPDAAVEPGQVIFPELPGAVVLPEDLSQRPAIGVVLSGTRETDDSVIAGHLASLAVERDCEVVILSEDPLSGFERFGFRTERIAGQTDARKTACIEQIRSFWGMEVIL